MKYLLVVVSVVFLIACDQGSDVTEQSAGVSEETRVLKGSVFEYGIYNPVRKGRERGDLTSNTGKVVTLSVLELKEKADRIPLVRGTYFAYRYRITGLPKEIAKLPIAKLRSVLKHPPMTLPDGTTTTGWDKMIRVRVSVSQISAFDGYVFSEDYELVAGEWTFQLWLGEDKVVEQKFTTYWPDSGDMKSANPADSPI